MAELSLRRAVEADVPTLMRIRLSVRENRLSDPSRETPQMCIDYLDRLGRTWLVEEAGEIIGFSAADREHGSIWALFVDPDREGRGAGQRLLREAVDWLFAQGHETLSLGTQAGTRADRFYAAQGWTRGEMKDEVEVWYRLERPAG